jgi:hypothetical protein
LNFALKFLNDPLEFCNPSAITCGQRCINTRPLEFARSVNESVGNCELPTNADRLYPSGSTSVIMAFAVNILQLSVKYRRKYSIGIDVGDSGIYGKYFSTLYKITMNKVRLEIHWLYCTVHDKLCLYCLFFLQQTLKLQTDRTEQ